MHPIRLPATPPPDPEELGEILDRQCSELLTLHGKRCAGIGPVLNTVMRSCANDRVMLLPSRSADRVTAWIVEHRTGLAQIVTAAAEYNPRLATTLATRLLLLCPSTMDSEWIGAIAELPDRGVEAADKALVKELAARCHIAVRRHAEADLLHGEVHQALAHLVRDVGAGPLDIALLWRRARLHWAGGDPHRTAHFLNSLGGVLDLHPDPVQSQLKAIAHAEVLLALGRHTDALTSFDRALGFGDHHDTLIARAGAHVAIGHTLRLHQGHDYAAVHWRTAHTLLNTALQDPSWMEQHHVPRATVTARRTYVETLLVTPSSKNTTPCPDFTLLGPAPTA